MHEQYTRCNGGIRDKLNSGFSLYNLGQAQKVNGWVIYLAKVLGSEAVSSVYNEGRTECWGDCHGGL